ncbi:preprotein translocase subunit SecE [Peptococcaceae bacterium 1198_IL3148]
MVASKKQGADGAALAKKEPKGPKKPTKAAKGSRVAGVKSFFNGVKIELKKVHWPTRRETMAYTGVVLSTVAVVSALLWILDSILGAGLSLILG